MRVGRTYVWRRNSSQSKQSGCRIFSVIAFLAAIAFGILTFRRYNAYRDVSASLSRVEILPGSYQSHPDGVGRVLHLQFQQNELIPQRVVGDNDFMVGAPGAWTMERDVEICQWREHYHERTQKHSDGTETVSRTYYYTKGWEKHHINSLFFDQPAAHHNPDRPLYSSGVISSTDVGTPRGYLIPASVAEKVDTPLSTVQFTPQTLQQFLVSPARQQQNFFYTGQGGWFVSKYVPSSAEFWIRQSMMYLEGTLLDFQLGDLFSKCDAGDVRVAFSVRAPRNGVSIIALQGDASGTLAPFQTLGGRDIVLVQEGIRSVSSMIETHVGGLRRTVLLFAAGTGLCVILTVVSHRAANKAKQEESQQGAPEQSNQNATKGPKFE